MLIRKINNTTNEYFIILENIVCLNGLLNRSVIHLLDKFIVYSNTK